LGLLSSVVLLPPWGTLLLTLHAVCRLLLLPSLLRTCLHRTGAAPACSTNGLTGAAMAATNA
jgi:hypothetical protein